MAKFANFKMRSILLYTLIFILGCATPSGEYIKSNHSISKKITANIQQILEASKIVLFEEKWKISDQLNPSVYERRSGGEEEGQDILLITYPKGVGGYLNVFILAVGDGVELEIRSSSNNHKLEKYLIHKIEEEILNSSDGKI